MKNRTDYDIVIIGAGASGLVAADVCGAASLKVLLLESKQKPGLKLLITGGGRCNISNTNMHVRHFNSRHPRTVKNVLAAFPLRKTLDYFKTSGVALHEENDGCLFPATQSAGTVLDALMKRLNPSVTLRPSSKVDHVAFADGVFRVSYGSSRVSARGVILCAGGSSYPQTGSDGSGFALAEMLGHSIIPISPALTPLATNDANWKNLAGIALPCSLSLKKNSGQDIKFEGPVLFTHIGFSGPCVLNISRYWIEHRDQPVVANFLPHEKETAFREKILGAVKDHPRQMVKTWLAGYLPARLSETIMKKAELDSAQVLGQMTRKEKERLIGHLFRCRCLSAMPWAIRKRK